MHVPGAWLEAQVLSIENGRLNLGELLTTGVFWVDATNVRVVKTKIVEGIFFESIRVKRAPRLGRCGRPLAEGLTTSNM